MNSPSLSSFAEPLWTVITISALVALAIVFRSTAKHLLPRLGRGEVMFIYMLLAMLTALMIWEGASLAGAALIFGIVLIGLRLRA